MKMRDIVREDEPAKVTKSDSTGVEITANDGVKTTIPADKAMAIAPDANKPGQFNLNPQAVAPDGAKPTGPAVGASVNMTPTAETADDATQDTESVNMIVSNLPDGITNEEDLLQEIIKLATEEVGSKAADEIAANPKFIAAISAAYQTAQGTDVSEERRDPDSYGDVGGDPTDDFINDVTDHAWERGARSTMDNASHRGRSSRDVRESSAELAHWLTIAGIK